MKKFGKILAMVMVALMMMSTAAFADAAIGEPAVSDYVVTATLTGLQASEEATILVLKDGVTLSNDIANSDIVYIDQLTTDENGSVTFTFDASAVVPAEEPTEDTQVYVDFYCGYSSMTAEPLAGTALVYNYEAADEIMYGDVREDGKVNNMDITFLARHLAGGYDLTINLDAADVRKDGKVNNMDLTFLSRFVAGGYFDTLPQ